MDTEKHTERWEPMTGIMVDGCLADFRANGCLGVRMGELAEKIMRLDAGNYPTLPEGLQGSEPMDLAYEFLLAMRERDLARYGGSGHTSWDAVLIAGKTDRDMVAFTRRLANNWLVGQFMRTEKGKEWDRLRKRLERAEVSKGVRMFVHYASPSSWGLAGGSPALTCVARRDLEAVARRHTIVRMRPKNPDGTRGGNLGHKGEVEALVRDVLTAAGGAVEQGVLFEIIGGRIVGDPVVASVRPVSDYVADGVRAQDFMDMALGRANGRKV